MGFPITNEVIQVKTEVTYNTDPTPAAGDSVLVRNVNMSSESLRMVDRGAIRASLGQLQKIYGGQLKRITFECEVKGSGTAGTAPEIGALLQACGMDETVVAVTSVTYQPVSSAVESVTIYYFEGGRKRHILTGCRGNVTFTLEAGGILLAQFDMVGHYTEPTDQSIPSPTYDSTVPLAGLGLTVSINGVSAIVAKSYSWALNNQLALPPSLSAADGYGEIFITGRDVTGEITIESVLDSVIDIDTLLSAGTRFAFAGGTIGGTAGNRVTISTPSSSTYVTDTSLEEADGLRLRRIPLAVDDSTADQEISVAFT